MGIFNFLFSFPCTFSSLTYPELRHSVNIAVSLPSLIFGSFSSLYVKRDFDITFTSPIMRSFFYSGAESKVASCFIPFIMFFSCTVPIGYCDIVKNEIKVKGIFVLNDVELLLY